MRRTSIVNDVSAPVANLGTTGNLVKIEKWVYGGEALARVDGRVVLAPFVLPGETVRLDQALAEMRDRLHDPRFPRFVHSLEIFTNETEVQVNALETDRPLARSFYDWCGSTVAIDYATSVGTFRVSPRSFFQVNRFLI